jgi:hypothetical protein
MKILYTVLGIFLCSMSAQCQPFTLTFEDTAVINQVFYTDTIIDAQGIWQIGSPNKSFLTDAFSPPNAVITLSDSLLPPGSRGSFIITLPAIQCGTRTGGLLTFIHRYEFDTMHGGAYVEYSVDTGRHWHEVIDSFRSGCYDGSGSWVTIDSQNIIQPEWWDNVPKSVTPSGIPYFTGTRSLWIYDTIAMPTFFHAAKTSQLTQIMFRFTAYADSLSPPLGGWLIDNIKYTAYRKICPGGGINELNSSHLHIYPDPVADAFTISMSDMPAGEYDMTLYDLTGRTLLHQSMTGYETTLHRGALATGPYFIQIMDRGTGATFQKRVVFE